MNERNVIVFGVKISLILSLRSERKYKVCKSSENDKNAFCLRLEKPNLRKNDVNLICIQFHLYINSLEATK